MKLTAHETTIDNKHGVKYKATDLDMEEIILTLRGKGWSITEVTTVDLSEIDSAYDKCVTVPHTRIVLTR